MIYVDRSSRIPIYRQIYEQVKNDIMLGNMRAGSKLVSTRVLANNLSVARNTVEYAYEQLYLEGYVQSKPSSGYIVQEIGKNLLSHYVNHLSLKDSSVSVSNFSDFVSEDIASWVNEEHDKYKFNFLCTSYSDNLFPYNLWSKLTLEALKSPSRHQMNSYNDKQGEIDLRIEIMKYLGRSRGVRCTAEQIVVCCGLQIALDVICKLLGNNSNAIAFEEPSNDIAREVVLNNGFDIIPIPVENDGINVCELECSNACTVVVTPSHQFPTGVLMSIQKRLQLLEWAVKKNAVIIEDDFDSELRYHASPIPSLQSIDTNSRVIYLGTFSKSLSTDLRASYIVLPIWLLPRYHKMFARYRPTQSWLQQSVLSKFIQGGHFDRHVRKLRSVFEKRHDTLVMIIKSVMKDKVLVHDGGAGTHIILEFTGDVNQKWLISRAKDFGVKVYSTTPFWFRRENCPQNTLLIGFSKIEKQEIIEGVTVLNDAWFV